LRRQHRLPADGPCLVFSGDYEYSAAHPVILAALPEIVRHHPGAVVVFACRTKTQEAIGIEAEVRRQVEAAGLAPHVRLLREVDDFVSLLALADVVLFPVQSLYRKMDIPVTLLQALALHRPIVASTLGPLQELLAKPVGLGVPPGDAVALAAAVCTLLGHPGRRASMGAAGHALVVEQYSAARMAASYERLYLSLARHQ
jgi:glycosyltransferase involved in cell wall biosynthesis